MSDKESQERQNLFKSALEYMAGRVAEGKKGGGAVTR